jgi:replicative DNA helicase
MMADMEEPTQALPNRAEEDPPWLDLIERDALAGMLHRASCLITGMERLNESAFFAAAHQQIYRAMISCQVDEKPVEYEDLLAALEPSQAEARMVLEHLEKMQPDFEQFDLWVDDLQQWAERRELLEPLESASKRIRTDRYSAKSVRLELMDQLQELHGRRIQAWFETSDRLVDQLHQRMDQGIYPMPPPMGTRTGFSGLDRILQGWQPGGCYLLCGEAGIGLTSLALRFALTAADQPVDVALISSAQAAQFLTQRMLAIHSGLTLEKLRTNDLSAEDLAQFTKAGEWHRQRPLYVCDNPFDSVRDLVAMCLQLHRDMGAKLVVVDDARLMGTERSDHAETVAQFKDLARQISGAVLMVSGEVIGENARLPADAILVLERGVLGEAKHRLRVAQNRHGKPGNLHLRMDEGALRFREVVPLTEMDGYRQ